MWQGQCVGVLDLDSPTLNRFTLAEAQFLEDLMKEIMPIIWEGRES
jgi:putative methionine-R-sulfoxide reductase with GAF domain